MVTPTITGPPRARRWLESRRALWTAFAAVHAWLAFVGVAWIPSRAFWDVDLYRYWVALGRDGGPWPVFDGPWVYPVGALLPMLVPAAVSSTYTAVYALGWSALVTALDAVAVGALVRRGGSRGACWWLAFLVLLGPVAMGRIDAILAPIVIVALLVATRRPRLAAALLTLGAWIKVAPGVLLLPLLMITRRRVRDVVVPAALVCAAFVGAVAAGGGLANAASFLRTQDARGLQVEAVAASPWAIAALVRDDVAVVFNRGILTWEIVGPGTTGVARALDVVLPLAVAGLAVLLWKARSRPLEVLVWGSLALATLLIVVNKVGSPQYVGWLAPPVAVALAARRPTLAARWPGPDVARPGAAPEVPGAETGVPDGAPDVTARVAALVLVIAAMTQIVFPFAYPALLAGNPLVTGVLVLRNAGLLLLLVVACVVLARDPVAALARSQLGGRQLGGRQLGGRRSRGVS